MGKQNEMILFDIGTRIRTIRTEIFRDNQNDFCKRLNIYLEQNFEVVPQKERFTQNTISVLEKDSAVTSQKLIWIINFLYDRRSINPLFLILKDNRGMPLYLKRNSMDKTLVDIHGLMKEESIKMNGYINEMKEVIRQINMVE